jgi:putative transposase
MKVVKQKSYKFRIYPNKGQQELLLKTFGCTRFVYNQTLNEKNDIYKELCDNKEKLYSHKYKTEKEYKVEFDWLKEVDSIALQQTRRDLNVAFKNFFKKSAKHPRFKAKHRSRQSYRTMNVSVNFESKHVKLPKVGHIKYHDNRIFDGKVSSATVSMSKTGKFFVSLLTKEEIEYFVPNENVIGIDLGLTSFAVDSNGNKFVHPKFYQKLQKKLAKEQRKFSRKVKSSNNRNKQRIRVARVYEKIRNQKTDYLHKLSSKIINENQVIIVEDLNVAGMVKNRKLSKSIMQSNWSEFVQMLIYKADWRGRILEKVDRFFPSTKLCSNCGHKNVELILSDREWKCKVCNSFHDRDINAAINLRNKNTVGTAEIYACGDMKTTLVASAQESISFREW